MGESGSWVERKVDTDGKYKGQEEKQRNDS